MRNKLISMAFGLAATGAAASAAALQPSQPAPPAAAASAVQPSEALRTRANQVVELLNGQRAPHDFFEAGSEQKFPIEQVNRVLSGIRERLGAAVGVSAIEADTPYSAVVILDMERGQLRARLGVAEQPPHGVIGFNRAP